jgi:alkylation response protein AidB-like acyl-CoA dehydrogenase
VELVVIAEEMGYALAPSPLHSDIAAALVLRAAGDSEERSRWLPAVADGSARGSLAVWDESSGWAPDHSEAEAPDGRMTAVKIAVPDAEAADFLIVAGADRRHYLVQAGAPGLKITPEPALDSTRKLYRVSLNDTPVQALSADPGDAIGLAYATIIIWLAAENVGLAQRALEMAVEHAKDRKQFDRPIGSYQAVSHRCAQMLLEVEGARSVTYWAAWALDHEPETAARAASMAKSYAGDAGFRVPASAIQVHGGIGFTWEHDLHFFLKRGQANAHAFGDSRWHRDRVIELAGV